MPTQYPAKIAAMKSREYVHNHDKAGWLGLFTPDAVIEDPIGVSYLDPNGRGHGTPEAREIFWNSNIANSDITITIHDSYGAANECANHVTLDLKSKVDGAQSHIRIKGIFTYSANDEGLLTALRGYWEPENLERVS
jgi:steroid delta-isomerase